jgi:DNA ligase-1
MQYLELANAFEKLEKTPSYLEKNKIIAQLLKKTPPDQIEKVVLLLLGRAWPTYVSKETGVAHQQLKKAIAIASGYETSEVEKLMTKTGDLGEVAEQLMAKRKQVSLFAKPLTVDEVFDTIKRLPEVTGSKSVDRKLELVAGLLTSAKPVEAKFIVRTVLGDLRIGVAEGRLRDAIATAFDVDPGEVEHAYMLASDYAVVARAVAESGRQGLKKVTVTIGHPVSPMLAQRAESPEEILERMNGKAAFEIKLDGIRIQTHKSDSDIWFFTRRMEDYTAMFPDLIEPARNAISSSRAIVDGELVAINPQSGKPMPFQEVLKRRRKYGISKAMKEIPVELHLFDVLLVEDKVLMSKPYIERRKMLEKIIKPNDRVKVVEQRILSTPAEVIEFAEYAVRIGHEGLLAKDPNSIYRAGRREFAWLKLKPTLDTVDLVVVGALYGKGKRAGVFGSYILAVRDETTNTYKTITKCGTGYSDEDLETLTQLFKPLELDQPHPDVEMEIEADAYFPPRVVFEVGFEEIQRSPEEKHTSGMGLRFPRFIRVREDKRPEEATTLTEIEQMYEERQMKKGKKG